MTSAGRRARVAALFPAVVVLVGASTAGADDLGSGWEGDLTYNVTATALEVGVDFTAPPGSVITQTALTLTPPVGSVCDDFRVVHQIAPGDGDGLPEPGTPTTPTTSSPPTTEPGPDHVRDNFIVDPLCNAVYDIDVVATGDPIGLQEPDDSDALQAADVTLSLVPPQPSGVAAVADAARRVTVRWETPSIWRTAGQAPSDALGFRVQRTAGDGAPVVVADLGPDETTVVDDGLVGAEAGTYTYQVIAARYSAQRDAAVISSPGLTTVELAGGGGGDGGGGTTQPSTVATTGQGPQPSVVGAAALPGQPAVGPPVATDPGFQTELDYSDAELGDEEAVPPADAGLFDISDDPVGNDLAIPAAVAVCLAVWAGHLRHLARRAAPPIH